MSEKSYDMLFKVLITGNSGVGKSSLLFRYANDSFHDEYTPTIGLDFKVKTVDMKGKHIKLQLWDTGGQEKFRTITNSYYRGAQAVLLVYDVTDQESFVRLKDWLRETDAYARENVVKILVGNKSDSSDARVVDFDMAKKFAAEEGVEVIEVSAKTGANINELFTTTTAKLLETFDEDDDRLDRLRLDAHGERRAHLRRSGCCSIM